jgi:hypothetical protein
MRPERRGARGRFTGPGSPSNAERLFWCQVVEFAVPDTGEEGSPFGRFVQKKPRCRVFRVSHCDSSVTVRCGLDAGRVRERRLAPSELVAYVVHSSVASFLWMAQCQCRILLPARLACYQRKVKTLHRKVFADLSSLSVAPRWWVRWCGCERLMIMGLNGRRFQSRDVSFNNLTMVSGVTLSLGQESQIVPNSLRKRDSSFGESKKMNPASVSR